MKKKILFISLLLLAIIPFIKINALDTEEYFNTNDNITSSKEVNHSRFLAGNKVTSNDSVKGLLFMAGNTLKAKNFLEYGFMAGNVIEITGNIEKDLFVAGNDVTIEEDAKVGRDVYIAGNTVTINSNVVGNLFITCSSIEFNDITLKGDILLDCYNITFGDNVKLEGVLKYNEDAKVDNLSKDYKVETYENEEVETPTFKENLSSKLFSTFSLFLVSIVLVLLFPGIYKKLSKEVTVSRIFKKMLIGLCALVVVPIASILVMITIIGIPLSIITLLLYGICVYLSIAVSSTVIGNLILTKLFKSNDNMYLSMLIGIVLVKLFSLIPYVGGIVYFLLMLVGLGLIIELLGREK